MSATNFSSSSSQHDVETAAQSFSTLELDNAHRLATDGASLRPLSLEEREENTNYAAAPSTPVQNQQHECTKGPIHQVQATADETNNTENSGSIETLSELSLSEVSSSLPQQPQLVLKKKNKKHNTADDVPVTNVYGATNVIQGDGNVINVGCTQSSKKIKSKTEKPVLPTVKLPCVEVTSSHMQTVASSMGRKWKKLGRYLDLDNGTLDIIEYDNSSSGLEEIIYQMLVKWTQVQGEQATLDVLGEALCHVEKHKVAELLKK